MKGNCLLTKMPYKEKLVRENDICLVEKMP